MMTSDEVKEKYTLIKALLPVARDEEDTKGIIAAETALDLLCDLHLKVSKIFDI